jgi:hypothetical protein
MTLNCSRAAAAAAIVVFATAQPLPEAYDSAHSAAFSACWQRAVKTACAAAEKRRVTRNTPNAHFSENYCLVFFSYYFRVIFSGGAFGPTDASLGPPGNLFFVLIAHSRKKTCPTLRYDETHPPSSSSPAPPPLPIRPLFFSAAFQNIKYASNQLTAPHSPAPMSAPAPQPDADALVNFAARVTSGDEPGDNLVPGYDVQGVLDQGALKIVQLAENVAECMLDFEPDVQAYAALEAGSTVALALSSPSTAAPAPAPAPVPVVSGGSATMSPPAAPAAAAALSLSLLSPPEKQEEAAAAQKAQEEAAAAKKKQDEAAAAQALAQRKVRFVPPDPPRRRLSAACCSRIG